MKKILLALVCAMLLVLPALAFAEVQGQAQLQGQTAVVNGGSPSATSGSSSYSSSSSGVSNSGNSQSSLNFAPVSKVDSKSIGLPSAPIPGAPSLQNLFFRLQNGGNIQDLAGLLALKSYWTLEEAESLIKGADDLNFRVKLLRPSGWKVDGVYVHLGNLPKELSKRMYPMAILTTTATSAEVDSLQSFGLILKEAIKAGCNVVLIQSQGFSEAVVGSGWSIGIGGQSFHVGGNDVGIATGGVGYGRNQIYMQSKPHHYAIGMYLPTDDPQFESIVGAVAGELQLVEPKVVPQPAAAAPPAKGQQAIQ